MPALCSSLIYLSTLTYALILALNLAITPVLVTPIVTSIIFAISSITNLFV